MRERRGVCKLRRGGGSGKIVPTCSDSVNKVSRETRVSCRGFARCEGEDEPRSRSRQKGAARGDERGSRGVLRW